MNARPRTGGDHFLIEGGEVIVVTAFRFPHGDAMSNRALQLTRAMVKGDARPLFVNFWPNDGSEPHSGDLPPGVRLVTLHHGRLGKLRRFAERLVRPLAVVRVALASGVRPGRPIVVLLPQGLVSVVALVAYKILLGASIVVDVTERHDASQFRRGRLDPYFLRHRWSALLTAHHADRVIAVSSSLARTFIERERKTIVVPPQVDCDEFGPSHPPAIEDGVRLAYAGTPGAKDLIGVIIDGIRLLTLDQRQRVHLTIAGVSRSEAPEIPGLDQDKLAALGTQVRFLGRISRKDVLELLATSHFSVLVRPPRGYANAGFPSKVPESLAAGCPVLLNLTSDLSQYVEHRAEGIVLVDDLAESVRDGLRTALSLTGDEWRQMSESARRRARESFDYRSFEDLVSPAAPHVRPERNRR